LPFFRNNIIKAADADGDGWVSQKEMYSMLMGVGGLDEATAREYSNDFFRYMRAPKVCMLVRLHSVHMHMSSSM
jgi:hypothetical protein